MNEQLNIEEMPQPFHADFIESSTDQWKDQLSKDLKGITFEELISNDRNGIAIKPFYTDSTVNELKDFNKDWFIMEKIDVSDEQIANKKALEALNLGASGITFILERIPDFEILFHQIDLPYIHTCIQYNQNDIEKCISQVDAFLETHYKESINDISIEYYCNKPYLLTNQKVFINSTIYSNAGATSITELSFIAAQVNEALQSIEEGNIKNYSEIFIKLAVDTQFYEQISKLRALKNIINVIVSEYNEDIKIHFSLETSAIYLSKVDVPNNILRNALAGLAAILGGAHNLMIQPYELQSNQDFINRIGRNQQLIFKEEAYLDSVFDVSKGSYFIENYTHQLGEKAWSLFQKIEELGGWNHCQKSGYMLQLIENDAKTLIDSYKDNNRILLGVNKYKPESTEVSKIVSISSYFGIPSVQIQDYL